MKTVEDYFKAIRFDPYHHLGLGDIRLTIGQQEEVVSMFKQERERTCEWVCEDSDVGIGANSSCGKYRFFPYGLDAELLCCFSCGGRIKIVVKNHSTNSNEMGREG